MKKSVLGVAGITLLTMSGAVHSKGSVTNPYVSMYTSSSSGWSRGAGYMSVAYDSADHTSESLSVQYEYYPARSGSDPVVFTATEGSNQAKCKVSSSSSIYQHAVDILHGISPASYLYFRFDTPSSNSTATPECTRLILRNSTKNLRNSFLDYRTPNFPNNIGNSTRAKGYIRDVDSSSYVRIYGYSNARYNDVETNSVYMETAFVVDVNGTEYVQLKGNGDDNIYNSCYIYPEETFFNDAKDMVFNFTDGTYLSFYENKSTGKCYQAYFGKRTDAVGSPEQ